MSSEESVGILCHANSCPGFRGILKQRSATHNTQKSDQVIVQPYLLDREDEEVTLGFRLEFLTNSAQF